ncbi:PREDICTED: uncharacterized protein LOC106751667 [Dinoponera quadriceps]|uniref:Uncharacterized protein LOC106751667 n=1 Tax=Dinoponera quadriceps TaxID=609295 RepID=A0A6P3YCI8_DINQU|nr:PREDICTED: uncharacterized protein LOC106751667 [Dinoponera quadriceps]
MFSTMIADAKRDNRYQFNLCLVGCHRGGSMPMRLPVGLCSETHSVHTSSRSETLHMTQCAFVSLANVQKVAPIVIKPTDKKAGGVDVSLEPFGNVQHLRLHGTFPLLTSTIFPLKSQKHTKTDVSERSLYIKFNNCTD